MSLVANLTQGTIAFLGTQVMGAPSELTAGEVIVNPSSAHGHEATGAGNSYILMDNNANFQLFRSPDLVLTFVYGTDDNASYWGGGDRTIYDYGQGTTLRFSDVAGANVYGFDTDKTSTVVIYNATDTTIQPDGQGGTLVGNIDFHNVVLNASRASFVTVPEQLSQYVGLVPLTT
jgi:hypothetical protein